MISSKEWKEQLMRQRQFGPEAAQPESEPTGPIRATRLPTPVGAPVGQTDGAPEAAQLRQAIESAQRAATQIGNDKFGDAPRALETAIAERREFWTDTCREMMQMRVKSKAVHALYQEHGCRFVAPSPDQVQYILNALDSAVCNWDQEHPELFYQTLELNFPELLRHH
jgi:hypothetical protein